MKIIAASSIKAKDKWTQEYRIVLRLDEYDKRTPFVVHLETQPSKPDSPLHGFNNGNYCSNILDATKAYVERCANNYVTPLDAQGNRMASIAPID